MPALAEHVRIARSVAGRLASSAGFDATGIGDVELAVTEACTNVVRHAYRDTPGRVELTVSTGDRRVVVVISDDGIGMAAISPDADGPGLGLPLMAQLAEEFEIRNGPGDGSEIRMAFVGAGDTLQPA